MDLKELKKLIKYLRSEGVREYKSDGIELKLEPLPPKPPRRKDVSSEVNEVPTDGPTNEELLFWSAAPEPKQSES